MHKYIIAQITTNDILQAIILGAQMSMQTVGVLTLIAMCFLLVGSLFSKHWGNICFHTVIFIQLFAAAVLYIARFPFYRTYHSGFNRMIFTGMHEDWRALFWTMVEQFNLPVRMLAAVILTAGLFYIWKKFFALDIEKKLPHRIYPLRWPGKIVFFILLYLLIRVSLFSGSWSWQTQINWENSAITKDNFLNEAILDDGQALYRAYCLEKRNSASNGLSYTPADVRTFAAYLSNKKSGSNNLDYYLQKTAEGAKIKKPAHIFLIISESYANWPLLDEYAGLHIADGMKEIIKQPDTVYCKAFLPNGSSTVNALMGIVTNLADANLYLTTMVNDMKQPYSTASAPQMKKLGYVTKFYYAGPSSWENIEQFTRAQGFDKFYSRSDIHETSKGSVWGADDKDLYSLVLTDTGKEDSFNVILNVSNHSPFEVDLKANGFDSAQVKNALAPQYRNDTELIKELGHFWYADRMLKNFIVTMREKYPDSLFIIVGDHADRYNIEKTPSMYKRYVIPFIITGPGIKKSFFPAEAVGSQIDIVPTLIELIAPKGFQYYSVGKSLTFDNKIAANYAFWLTDGYIGKTGTNNFAPEEFLTDKKAPTKAVVTEYADAIRAVSWWKAKYGNIIGKNALKLTAKR
ncbi:LTA synthase family protein [Pectinatus sottacetonis]|uniref:LTA synthase family protein n=1 Tax=Pectinatus sottacetonis TaxID=1002795 RepID=UPI001E4CE60D|nr:alkaline phosphatase family protein [Pectinatus sottacetonis]